MKIADANIILRYLLKDNEEFYCRAAQIIEENNIYLPFEVIAEIVYVLEKVYKVPRIKINSALVSLFSYENIDTIDKDIIVQSLNLYSTTSLDFVDTLLIGYNKVRKYKIFSFDKKLINKLPHSMG